MLQVNTKRKYGELAIQKGFITKKQLINAMKIQIEGEQDDSDSTPIGIILRRLGYINNEQAVEIVKDIIELENFKCPTCGVLLHECPNCGDNLMKYYGVEQCYSV
ncbi:hypothetical protein ACFLZG_06375 [Thermodesulfobacteriota bacterium]